MKAAATALVTVILLLSGVSSVAAQDRGMELLQRTAARYQGVGSLCADFVQHLLNPLLRQERTGRGRLCQTRPNLFGMRFTDPAGDLFVVDGESVWYYVPSNDDKQAFRTPVDRTQGGPDFHREFLVDPETKYEVTYEAAEDVAGTATHRLRLDPISVASYSSAVLWLDAEEPVLRQIRIIEENGNERTITLTDIEFDVAPPGGWFEFTPPPGVLVITA